MPRMLPAVLVALTVACRATEPAPVHFADDYEAARLAAIATRLPLVVEVWAPW